MKELSKEEKHRLLALLKEHPDLVLNISKQLKDCPFKYVENASADLDKEYFEEFMKNKLEKVLRENKEKIRERIKGNILEEEEIFTAFQESGSYGLTILIGGMLEKMEKSRDFRNEIIENLIALVKVRNELQHYEIEYLKEEYKEYLEAQILHLEKNTNE